MCDTYDMHQGQLDENRRAPSRAPLPEPTTLSSNLLPLAFIGYLLVDGGNGSAPGERGIGGRRDFVVLYVVGYPDFGNLMMLCIDGISIILTAGMPHSYFSIVVGRYLDRFARFYSLQPPLFPLQKRKKKKPSDSLSFFSPSIL